MNTTIYSSLSEFTSILSKSLAVSKKNNLTSPLQKYALVILLSQDPRFHDKLTFPHDLNEVEFIELYKNIVTDFRDANNSWLIANKACLTDDLQFQEHFKFALIESFLYEIEVFDFENNNASKSINAWVEKKTYNKNRRLTDSDNIEPNTYLSLLNTVYFNDKWSKPFNEKNTAPAIFHLNVEDTTQIQMMKSRSEFLYKNDKSLEAEVLQISSESSDVNIYVILPNKGKTIANVEDRCNQFSCITNDMVIQEVDVYIPCFEMEQTIDFKNYLNEFGLDDQAYFIGMVDSEEFLKINNIHHKAVLSINEEGIEATTGVVSNLVPDELEDEVSTSTGTLVINEMNIKANVSNRFVKTVVVCNVKNERKSAEQATFSVILPETAFITEFLMKIEKKTYRSYVKEREKAQNIYNQALASGQSAGLIEATTRDSNKFTVTVNLEPECVAVFSLTYEELLQRVKDQYELVININPAQIVPNLNVEVCVKETRPLKFVRTPALRSGNEISRNVKFPDPCSDIETINSSTTVIKFSPDAKRQKNIARYLGTQVSEGFSGQFVVQYDVERDPHYGEILLQDGYFVHFFAPNDLDPLPKHVAFVLDSSSSMGGRKMIQVKDAMTSILNEIGKDDIISIVEFNSNIIVWDINSEDSKILPSSDESNHDEPFEWIRHHVVSRPAYANEVTINKAKNVVRKFMATGCTNIIGALETALYLIKTGQERIVGNSRKYQPIVVFLTDGEPTCGITSPQEIITLITRLNSRNGNVPIFSLSFGDGADKQFLRELSLKNYGFSRHVYEASDASLQLQEFYKQISSPLLNTVRFVYESEVEEVTRTCFPIYFGGSELVVTGRCKDSPFPTTINGYGSQGSIILASTIQRPVTTLERLWAFLTVRQLLEEINFAVNKTDLIKRGLELALKYSFVTDLTSLVVVKPEEEEEASTLNTHDTFDDMTSRCNVRSALLYQSRRLSLTRIGWRMISSPIRLIKRKFYKKKEALKKTPPLPPQEKEPEKFLVDRPFIVIIQYTKDNRDFILFKGHIYNPTPRSKRE